jgi:thiol:disulfide interchange protein
MPQSNVEIGFIAMERFLQSATFLFALLLCASLSFGQRPQTREDNNTLAPIERKTDLYPANADAKKEIDEVLQLARADKKRVLLIFGGNWCYDCHVLDRALHEGEAGKVVKESFLLVHVDIGEGDKNPELVKKYKIPLEKGVPAVVVLNGAGDLLFSSTDGEFEAARRMMKKDLLAFLKHWQEEKR